MNYLIEPWQQHAARVGDMLIARHMPVWDQIGWTPRVLTRDGWRDAGLGAFNTLDAAERAALNMLGRAHAPR